jgi:hypothetical protein
MVRPHAEGRQLPSRTVTVTGCLHGEVEPVPATVLLGARPVGGSAKQTVVLNSMVGRPFQVKGWKTSSPDLVCTESDAGGQKVYTLIQQISKAGHQHGQVNFTVHSGSEEAIIVPLDVCYHGLPPQPPDGR